MWIVVFLSRVACELFHVVGPVLLEIASKFPAIIMNLVYAAVKTVACVIDLLKSDAVQRIIDIIIEAVPIIIEIYGTILCNLVAYGMPVFCYLLYAVCVPLSFILERNDRSRRVFRGRRHRRVHGGINRVQLHRTALTEFSCTVPH